MPISRLRILWPWTLSVLLILAGCGTTNILVSQWSNPAYTSPSFKTIMVSGASAQTSIRRNFEDQFVAQLKAAGFDAVASYRYIPESETVDEANVRQTAQKVGADAAFVTRLVGTEQRTQVMPGYYPAPFFGFYGGYGYGLYGGPYVYCYDVYTSETTLYDVAKNEIVWTATLKSIEPDNIDEAIKRYVEAVISALSEKNLLRKGPRSE